MESTERGDSFLFEGFRLDRRGGGLFQRDGSGVFVPVPIGPRALDVLGVLVERAGELVTRDELIAAVWPETVVEDNNLNMQIAALRRVLDAGRPPPGCIQTIPRRGYRRNTCARNAGAPRPDGSRSGSSASKLASRRPNSWPPSQGGSRKGSKRFSSWSSLRIAR